MRSVPSTLFDPSPTALMQDLRSLAGQDDGSLARQETDNPAHQTVRLLNRLENLIHAHEREIAQRQALQDRLDRLVEALESGFESGRAASAPDSLGEDIRKGVSDELKPLLHAIIDLLELATRPAPDTAAPGTGAEADTEADTGAEIGPQATRAAPAPEHGASADPGPRDELPRALPEILTKSITELVGTQGNRRANDTERKAANTEKPAGKGAPGARNRVWIPVAPGTRGS